MKGKTVLLVVFVFLIASLALAQGMGTGKGRGSRSSNYDPKTETTVTGVVEEVKQNTGPRGNTGTHAAVKTQNGVVDVHVGPTAFLSKQGLALAKGDPIEITGSKVTVDSKEAFIAREVKKDSKTFVLRDSVGKPMWSGSKR